MSKISNQTEQYTNTFVSMEAETIISKNAAIPKSHTIRRNFLMSGILLLALGFTTAVFISCGGNSIGGGYNLEVKIPNGSQYSGQIDSVGFERDREHIISNNVAYNNGNFILKLKDIPESFLRPLENIIGRGIENVKISDPDTRGTTPKYGIAAYNKRGYTVGRIGCINQNPMKAINETELKAMMPMYFDRKCEISGTVSVNEYTATYNLSLKKGWNMVYEIREGKTRELTTTPQSGLEWIVIIENNFN